MERETKCDGFVAIVKEPFAVPKQNPASKPVINKNPVNYDQFFQAIRNNDVQFVKDALEKGANPDRTDWMGQTALHEACACGSTEVAELLLLNHASPNKLGVDKQTPLHVACLHGHFLICSALINSGADYNIQDKNGNTPLHAAASKNRAGVVALLFSQGNVKIVKNRSNQFPIDLSAQQGDCYKILSGQVTDFYEYSGLAFAQADHDDIIPFDEISSDDDEIEEDDENDDDYEDDGEEDDEEDGDMDDDEGGMDVENK